MTPASDTPGPPGHGEVHLWFPPLDADARAEFNANGKALLSRTEKARLHAMKRAEPMARFLRGRILMRRVLGLYLSVDPADVPLVLSDTGKPALVGNPVPHIEFNLSHTDTESVFAVTGGGCIGVDIEAIVRADAVMRISEQFFTPVERRYINLGDEDRAERALTIWCLKEAVVKALDLTVWAGLAGVTIGPEEGRFRALALPEAAPRGLCLSSAPFNGAHVVGVAVEGSPPRAADAFRTFRLDDGWSETGEFVPRPRR